MAQDTKTKQNSALRISKPAEKPELTALVEKWQKRLRLEQWRITVEYSDEPDEAINGDVETWAKKLMAHIRISNWSKNPEETLVHEMLHILMSPICEFACPMESIGGIVEEQIVSTLTEAFTGIPTDVKFSTKKEIE